MIKLKEKVKETCGVGYVFLRLLGRGYGLPRERAKTEEEKRSERPHQRRSQMKWIKLPEMKPGTERAHWFAYCWSCQRNELQPGMFLQSQLYFNPFIHTEPICEDCARRCDPDFGRGSELKELEDETIEIIMGDEPECPHKGPKSFYSVLPSMKIVIACSYKCAEETLKRKGEEWKRLADEIGL
ncbi:MAG: hypothetical protein KAV68_05335 [Dehalococcoidales bacterium]|nr:hypothetical protein [Dehalococcoidales bacterium]